MDTTDVELYRTTLRVLKTSGKSPRSLEDRLRDELRMLGDLSYQVSRIEVGKREKALELVQLLKAVLLPLDAVEDVIGEVVQRARSGV